MKLQVLSSVLKSDYFNRKCKTITIFVNFFCRFSTRSCMTFTRVFVSACLDDRDIQWLTLGGEVKG